MQIGYPCNWRAPRGKLVKFLSHTATIVSAVPVSSFLQIAHGELSSASVGNFGKYRDLVIAIALFLILDLGVLVLNFFASTLIETDAARINIASELRMLSQQMTKPLLTMIGQAQRHFGDDLEISVPKTFQTTQHGWCQRAGPALCCCRSPGMAMKQCWRFI